MSANCLWWCEDQPVLGASGEDVQRVPHPPEELPARLEGAQLLIREKAVIDQLAEGLRTEMAPRHPGDRLNVAQTSGTLLDVRFEVVGGVVELVVACALLEHLGLEEPAARPDAPRSGARVHRASRLAEPHTRRPSMRLVATVTSRLATFTHSATVRTLELAASPTSHRNARNRLTFSPASRRIRLRVRMSRSMSDPGAARRVRSHRPRRGRGRTDRAMRIFARRAAGHCRRIVSGH